MFAQVFVGFGSPLARTRLETVWPIADDVSGIAKHFTLELLVVNKDRLMKESVKL